MAYRGTHDLVVADGAGVDSVDALSPSAADSARKRVYSDLLRGIRVESSVAFWPEFRAPWGVSVERDWAVFHIVEEGACWMQVRGVREPVELHEGDFAVITQGQFHTLGDRLSTPVVNFFDLVKLQAPGKMDALSFGGKGTATKRAAIGSGSVPGKSCPNWTAGGPERKKLSIGWPTCCSLWPYEAISSKTSKPTRPDGWRGFAIRRLEKRWRCSIGVRIKIGALLRWRDGWRCPDRASPRDSRNWLASRPSSIAHGSAYTPPQCGCGRRRTT